MSDDARDLSRSQGNAIDGGSEFEQARKALRNSLAPRRPPPAPSRSATPRFAPAPGCQQQGHRLCRENVQASLDHAQSLLKAKDLPEVMRLHSEYVQAQMRALAEQASEMGQVVGKAAMDAAKPKPDCARRVTARLPLEPASRVKFAASHQKLQCAAQI